MKLSLKAKFLVSTILLLALGMGVSTIVSVSSSNGTLDRITREQQATCVELTLRQINAWITDRKLEMIYWGKQDVFSVAIDGAFVKMADTELQELKKDYSFYEIINVADPHGAIIASSDKTRTDGLNVAERPYFIQALSGNTVVSDVIQSKSSGNPVFVVAAPVLMEGNTVGVIFGVVSLDYFNRHFIVPVRFGSSGFVYVVGPSGMVIAHPDTDKIMNLDLSTLPFGKELLGRTSGRATYAMDRQIWTAAYRKGALPPWTVVAAAAVDELRAPGRRLRNINVLLAAGVIALAVLIIFIIARSVVKPIYRAIDTLTESSEQMSTSARLVAAASQSQAQSTGQQAASLEETSASLEELSSVSQQNSASAQTARQVASEAQQSAREGAASMGELMSAMEGISQSSAEVTNVVQAIEEIAFQTNLLALNAAVEAARAGEAGRGFAVVAEEVRSLAQRSAEQAHATRQLIEASTARTQEGSTQAAETDRALQKIIEAISRVTALVEEISSASQEQARGVDQINHAVSEMDKSVQQNAATAQESASSIRQMASEAQEVKNIIDALTRIIEGSRAAAAHSKATAAGPAAQHQPKQAHGPRRALGNGALKHPGSTDNDFPDL